MFISFMMPFDIDIYHSGKTFSMFCILLLYTSRPSQIFRNKLFKSTVITYGQNLRRKQECVTGKFCFVLTYLTLESLIQLENDVV